MSSSTVAIQLQYQYSLYFLVEVDAFRVLTILPIIKGNISFSVRNILGLSILYVPLCSKIECLSRDPEEDYARALVQYLARTRENIMYFKYNSPANYFNPIFHTGQT